MRLMSHSYIVSGPRLPQAAAPISQAVVAGDHCYVSGQLATGPTGDLLEGTVRIEVEGAFQNLYAALGAAGFTPEDLVYVDVALLDIADMPVVNEVWTARFPGHESPARTIYQAAALPYGGRVKVQGVAIRRGGDS